MAQPVPSSAQLRRRRAAPIAAAAIVAFAAGLVIGAGHQSGAQKAAQRYADAWAHSDWARMYTLSDATKRGTSVAEFTAAYSGAAGTATATRFAFGHVGKERNGAIDVPATVQTRIWGTVKATLRLPMTGEKVAFQPDALFPGLLPGERLGRRTALAPRASILARNGTPLATGPQRTSPLGSLATSIAGQMGDPPPDRLAALRARGVPDGAKVGIGGLERAFDDRLRGLPGGDLLAGSRILAHAAPRRGRSVRTTIAPKVQQAAVLALGGRLGGVVALRPRTGEILAAAGIPFSGLQPPGSTMKMVTVTGALEAGITTPTTAYPVQTQALLSGVPLQNANGEACGGTLAQAFAQSCNSVFAPLGAKLGGKRFVSIAERFGFNEDPGIPGVATSGLPRADQIGDDLAVGSSAIGQAKVQATALQMGLVAAAIGMHGRRPRPVLELGRRRSTVRATSARVAAIVERLMEGVVSFGTGTAAAIPGVPVAGKTGTAELVDTRVAPGQPIPPPNPANTDAWFAAFAPAGKGTPRVAVGVLLVHAGAGGASAAPVARDVLIAALK